ncbi:MAG: aminopeptidase [Myxococcaceae bacterium]|nr:aminopeptidase [Myxococcaceae bacterium]
MKESSSVVIRREDYRPPPYTVEQIDLLFALDEQATRVTATSQVRRTEQGAEDAPLVLDGQRMVLESISIDGRKLTEGQYTLTPESLVVPRVPARFVLEVVSTINPAANKALEGLFLSSGNFCTQCEAEGFRCITWFIDRPDVMARYTTRIEADKKRYPVLLSNGNLVSQGELDGGKHFAVWEDPFLKPCYLFALVAGNLSVREDSFTTMSGRKVKLQVFTAQRDLDQTEHCLASLKRAMAWDEQAFGREYDLDIYMIVAVRDFNMGAMENKGLNVFNTKYVLARQDTATDSDFLNVEAVVGHEYFHNWSGNRVTCRDWFQLSLKEGFTVFRDQEFSSDVGSRALKRIQDVQRLLATQFPEDAGPTAHPVRPDAYSEINNFYTATVYEKGSEVVRMIQTLVGKEAFRKGCDLYFERHDGQAVTCDEFVQAHADTSGVDLSQFKLWYSQAGTPVVTASTRYDAKKKTFELKLAQRVPPTPGQPEKQPAHIPILMGLIGQSGADLALQLADEQSAHATQDDQTSRLLELRQAEQTFTFVNVPERPAASLLRGFSAPVRLETDCTDADLLLRMAHDSDSYCRWDAAQSLAQRRIFQGIEALRRGERPTLDAAFVEAFGRALGSDAEPPLLAQALALPAESVIADRLEDVDPSAVHEARAFIERELASAHRELLLRRYDELSSGGAHAMTSEAMGRRSLRNLVLRYLTAATGFRDGSIAKRQFDEASNMTDMIAALAALVNVDGPEREAALAAFYDRFQDEALVVDKWFSVQATSTRERTLDEVIALMAHPAFQLDNPNRARSLIDSFASGNPLRFHDQSGRGYAFLRERVLEIDRFNGQVSARMVGPLTRFSRYEPRRRALMIAELQQILEQGSLSTDLSEQVGKAMQAARSTRA